MTFEKLPSITCDAEGCNNYHVLTREEFKDINEKTDWLELRRTNENGLPVGSHYCPDCVKEGKLPSEAIEMASWGPEKIPDAPEDAL